jgi:hypothetical protein
MIEMSHPPRQGDDRPEKVNAVVQNHHEAGNKFIY